LQKTSSAPDILQKKPISPTTTNDHMKALLSLALLLFPGMPSGAQSTKDGAIRLDSLVHGTSWKEFFTYDEKGWVHKEHIMEWDPSFGKWLPYWGVTEYTWDEHRRMTSRSQYAWDFGRNELFPYSRNEYEYNEAGSLTRTTGYQREAGTENWRPVRQTDYEYDELGLPLRRLNHGIQWETGEWIHFGKEEYEHNHHGHMVQKTALEWIREEAIYRNSGRHEYTHEYGDMLMEQTQYRWQNQAWIPLYREVYLRNKLGGLLESVGYRPGNHPGSWTPQHRSAIDRDMAGNPIRFTLSDWNDEEDGWTVMEKHELTYDPAYPIEDLSMPVNYMDWRGEPMINMPISLDSWQRINGVMTHHGPYRFHYSGLSVTRAGEPHLTEASVYPNPARDVLMVRTGVADYSLRFDMYDLQGRLLVSRPVSGLSTIALDGLPKGLYIYRLDSGHAIQEGKILKE
jgi:hypothetical protein